MLKSSGITTLLLFPRYPYVNSLDDVSWCSGRKTILVENLLNLTSLQNFPTKIRDETPVAVTVVSQLVGSRLACHLTFSGYIIRERCHSELGNQAL